MKLVRYGAKGAEKPGLLDDNHGLRDLSQQIPDLKGAALHPDSLAKLHALDPSSLPAVDGTPRLGPPITGVRNFIGIGLNYADHAAEAGLRVPREPVIFNKIASCINGPVDDVIMPKGGEKLDWEVELAFVVAQRAYHVPEDQAMDYIAGFMVCNDVSERHYQTERSGQWVKGKSAETFGPIGPWLVTADEVGDMDNLGLWLDVNGERKQTGNTATMVFKIPYMLAYVSRFMILEPGDIIATGTPPGVALGMKEPQWLKVGDVVSLGIDKLGSQSQKIVAFDG